MADDTLDDLDILEQVEDPEPEKEEVAEESEETPEKESTEETEETEEEEKVEEKEEEEEPEPDEAEKLAQGRLTFKEVKEKFPTLFKEFPQLRHVFFHEQEYAKVFPTVEDAQEAAKKAENYTYLEADLLEGKPENLLASISQASPEAFDKIAESFLPAVYKINKDAFYTVTRPIITNALRAAFNEGTQDGNKNLATAAQYINRFLFGSIEIEDTKPVKSEPQVDPEREKFEKERAAFIQSRANEFETSVQQSVKKELTKLVAAGLDPENKLNEFTRSSIIDKTIERIGSVLAQDTRHKATMNSLWKRAWQSGLTPEAKARILQTHIGRVKEILPTIRAKVRAEAIGESKPKAPIKRFTGNATGKQDAGVVNPKKVDWGKTSDLDILNDNIKLKK